MDIRKVKKLIELLEESQLAELEIREGEESIRISRGTVVVPATMPPAAGPAAAPTPDDTESPGDELPSGHAVSSPMVGTFYDAPSPETKPFVEIGSVIREGDTLCIIEAMKIFNEIEADRSGAVRAIMKKSGEPVEYGETLFIID